MSYLFSTTTFLESEECHVIVERLPNQSTFMLGLGIGGDAFRCHGLTLEDLANVVDVCQRMGMLATAGGMPAGERLTVHDLDG